MQPDPTRDPAEDDLPEDEGSPSEAPPPPVDDLPVIDPGDLIDEGDDDEAATLDLLDDEFDDFDEDDDSRTVLITGACGNIGRKLRAAWEDVYDLILLDVAPGEDDAEVFQADLSEFDEDWITHFHGVDTVVHLAADRDEHASPAALQGPNLDALANVLNAAALAGVERVVYASSVHVMGGHREDPPEVIRGDAPPNPSGAYGTLKLAGERFGKSMAHAFDVTFVALRLGHVQDGPNRPDTLPDDDWSRRQWLSNGDLVRLFDAAVEASIEDRVFLVVNGVSRNQGGRWDLTVAAEILGYLPEDDAFAPRLQVEPPAEDR
ncbi:NAD-dependent epimerase/dehydratase family protein [Paludisphaera sp.]|uniref:NAD-dependent epimerase/dehydratase family protein n=1 Tax=Paludisphaera sp. TaxID=2017432 RepID=UPI00301D321A